MEETINIPLSTKVNNLSNEEDVFDDDLIYNGNSEINLDFDIDQIISNQVLYDNFFIQNLMEKCDFEEKDSIPDIHDVAKIYLKNIYDNIYPKNCTNKGIVFILRLIHIIGIIFLIFGCLLPNNLLKYHIIFSIKTLVLWEFLNDNCYISLLIKKISNLNKCPELLPENMDFCKNLILIVMFISIFGIIVPDLSPFKIIIKTFELLKKYD